MNQRKGCTPTLPCMVYMYVYSGFVRIAIKENWKMFGTSSCTVRMYSECQNKHSCNECIRHKRSAFVFDISAELNRELSKHACSVTTLECERSNLCN